MANKAFWARFWAKYDPPVKTRRSRFGSGGGSWFWKIVIFILIAALVYGGYRAANRFIPHQHLPWQSLDMSAPIGLATGLQLSRFADGDGDICLRRVGDVDDFETSTAPARRDGAVCGWTHGVNLRKAGNTLITPRDVEVQCGLSAGIYIWLRALQDEAVTHLGSSITEVFHYSSYSCRRQNGNDSGAWSEHAFANAWDISGFELADGRRIMVLADWNGADAAKRKFLRAARDRACDVFRVTLSPDYNAAHADHFHVDMGPQNSCR